MRTLKGACGCGNIRFEVQTVLNPGDFGPRACDCDFCKEHGAEYFSDAQGSVKIQIADTMQVERPRHGSEQAEFLKCKKCGEVTGAFYTEAGRTYGAINVNQVSGDGFFNEPVSASPKKLSPEEKVSRWKEIWFKDVKF